MDQGNQQAYIPSLYRVRCPHCGSADYWMLGEKGVIGSNAWTFWGPGAVAALANPRDNSADTAMDALQYVCNGCKKKFLAEALRAGSDELLESPATVSLKRMGAFFGFAVPQTVYINGYRAGEVANGKTIAFQTPLRFNLLAVTDQFGAAFRKGTVRFEARPGGVTEFRFRKKFL